MRMCHRTAEAIGYCPWSREQLEQRNTLWMNNLAFAKKLFDTSEEILLAATKKTDLISLSSIKDFFNTLPRERSLTRVEELRLSMEGLNSIATSMAPMIHRFVIDRTRINQEQERKVANGLKKQLSTLSDLVEESKRRWNEFRPQLSFNEAENIPRAMPQDSLELHRAQFGNPEEMGEELRALWDECEEFLARLETGSKLQMFDELMRLWTALDDKHLAHNHLTHLYYKKFPETEMMSEEQVPPALQALPSLKKEPSCSQMIEISDSEGMDELAQDSDLKNQEPESLLNESQIEQTHLLLFSETETVQILDVDTSESLSNNQEASALIPEAAIFADDHCCVILDLTSQARASQSLSTEVPSTSPSISERTWTQLEASPAQPAAQSVDAGQVIDKRVITKTGSDNALVYFFQKFHEFFTRVLHFLFCGTIPIVAYQRPIVRLEINRD